MLTISRKRGASTLLLLFALSAFSVAQAPQPVPYSEVHTVAGPAGAVPLESSFNIATAGTYTVKLVDIGATLTPPAPVGSVELAISSGSQLVTLTPSSSSRTATELTGAGTATFTASPGPYVIHVAGMPGQVPGSGPIGVQVTDSGNNVVSGSAFSGTLALPPTAVQSNIGTLVQNFSAPAGTYQLTLSDLSFPQQLTTLTVTLVSLTSGNAYNLPAAGSQTLTLPADSYTVVALGQAGGAVNAGLFSVTFTPSAGGAPVFAQTVPVGAVQSLGGPTLSVATYTLTTADLHYPAALTQLGAIVVLNGRSVAQVTSEPGGSQPFTASAATYQVFGLALPSSTSAQYPGTGSYAVSLQSSAGSVALDVARAVASSTSGFVAYSYDTAASDASNSPQSYQLDLADFSYPTQFAHIIAAAAQGIGPTGTPAVLGNPTASPGAGTQMVTPAAGAVSLLVLAQPANASGNTAGLFGLDWEVSGSSTPTFETTQATGSLFSTRTVNVTAAGNYQVSVADLGFPAPFANLAVFITRGASTAGSAYGAGSFPFPATPGNYDISFIEQGSSASSAGTYAISLTTAPPAPAITFSSNSTSVSSGSTVMLTWSVQNATSCSLSGGGFSNAAESVSGSATSQALTATTTFTLSCTGAGGSSSSKQVVVTVTPAPSGGGGGGGAIGGDLLAFLLAAAGLRVWLRPRRA
jgi:hypothetical protein